MLEKDLEAWLGKELKSRGCLYYKTVSPGHVGFPDRIAVLPDGAVIFIELKTDTGVLSATQKACHRQLKKNNAMVHVVKGYTGAQIFLMGLDLELRRRRSPGGGV